MTASVLPRPDVRAGRRSTTLATWTRTDLEPPAAWAADLVIDDLADPARPAWPTYC
ncbi:MULTISPECIES: hypothetical protein [Nonomuraea]|uniref:hypothetical protein n=1 Tax=Nonomuraea TaxID=83681 RepID=UPI001378F89F|nr:MULTISPECIES: hypothetical protein [Nonomuraea]NBE91763.1 hypothetical protein [Nonomuraea sp. K271]